MPSWNDLLSELDQQKDDAAKNQWLQKTLLDSLNEVSTRRSGANVLFYASAFLQKPGIPSNFLSITADDLNGDPARRPGHLLLSRTRRAGTRGGIHR